MIGLGSDRQQALASTASEYARRSLTEAIVEAMEEADLQRARRTRRRWIAGSILGMGIGATVGYFLASGQFEGRGEELGTEAVEAVSEMAPESLDVQQLDVQEEQSSSRSSGALPKLLAIGAGAIGLYLLRKRSSSTEEIVADATQRARSVGGEAGGKGAQEGQRTEAVAGGGTDESTEFEDAGDATGNAPEESGDAFDNRFEGAAEEGEDVQEGSEEPDDES